MALHMGVAGYRVTFVTKWKQLGQIPDSTGTGCLGKIEEERERSLSPPSLRTVGFQPFSGTVD